MKILITRDLAHGGQHQPAGTEIDCSDAEALALINMGKAQAIDETKSNDRSIGLKKSETKLPSKRKKK